MLCGWENNCRFGFVVESTVLKAGFKKTWVFKKKAQPSGFFGFYWVFWTSRKK